MNFRVWAPKAEKVELVIEDRRIPMTPAQRGWWTATVKDAHPGDRYGYALDGGPVRPDPRSPDQPDGVHAPSRIVDHAAYKWQHADFRPPTLASAIIYELHIGGFTPQGTLEAAADRLDHLADLGITHIELMPLNSFDGDHGWGYDGVAWFAPHRAYTGNDGPDAVKRFVDACHQRGLAVILDVVYNHLGPSGNYLSEFGHYFTDAYHTPWGPAMNLDGPGSDETRRLIIDNALSWLRDYRFDALRIDAVHAFHDRSATHLLEQLRHEVGRFQSTSGRRVDLIAESDLNDPRVVRSPQAGGFGMDAQWCDDFHHALHALLTADRRGYYADFGSVADLAKSFRHAFVHDGKYSNHRQRTHGRSTEGLTSDRFLAYCQTHDQVGNRAMGDRLTHLLPFEALELTAALYLLSPFVPMIFMGEEWGATTPFQYFTDHQDPDLGHAVREGRRREFGDFVDNPEKVPDPQDPATFHRSKLDWNEPKKDQHAALLDWYHRLITFRKSHPNLAPGPLSETQTEYSESPPWLRLTRGPLTLLFNLGPEPANIPIGSEARAVLLTNDSAHIKDHQAQLKPYAVAILGPNENT